MCQSCPGPNQLDFILGAVCPHRPTLRNAHETVQLHFGVLARDPLVVWPELFHPVDLPHDAGWQNLRTKRGARNLERDHVADLVPFRGWGMVVLGPLAQRPIGRGRLARNVFFVKEVSSSKPMANVLETYL
jgi:hypothetical protein